jgi:hypothetical protein
MEPSPTKKRLQRKMSARQSEGVPGSTGPEGVPGSTRPEEPNIFDMLNQVNKMLKENPTMLEQVNKCMNGIIKDPEIMSSLTAQINKNITASQEAETPSE